MITVSIADDQSLFRKGLVSLLRTLPGIEVTSEASNGKEILEALEATSIQPMVILLDIKMPVMDGYETTQVLRKRFPEIKIIILTNHTEDRFILNLLESGAHAYLFKDAEPEELELSIQRVVSDGFYFSPAIYQLIQDYSKNRKASSLTKSTLNPLTTREIEVLKLICQELSTEEIADTLFISKRTVEGHRNNLLLKTGAKNMAGLVIYAVKNNVILMV